jgi:hypothetical protein
MMLTAGTPLFNSRKAVLTPGIKFLNPRSPDVADRLWAPDLVKALKGLPFQFLELCTTSNFLLHTCASDRPKKINNIDYQSKTN